MALAFGTKLGEYEIAAPIGAGGLGDVYKAHDTKLGRDVAIRVLPDGVGETLWSLLPDDQGILAVSYRRDTGGDIDLVLGGESRPILEEPFDEGQPSVSPDGRWIAYRSNESGRDEIYVRPFPDVASGKYPISSVGRSQPLWASSGRELFYRSDAEMMAVTIETDPAFSAGTRTRLFEDSYYRNVRREYDISPDGRRFLMIKEGSSDDTPRELHVVLNWHQELKRLVPTE